MIYKRELADLYIIASKTLISLKGWRGIRLHGGVDYIGASLTSSKMLRTSLTDGNMLEESLTGNEMSNEMSREIPMSNEKSRETLKKLLPFGGIEIWATKKAKLMGEFEWVANFDEEDMPKLEDEPVWMAIIGARIFLTRFLTADIGVRYQENFKTAADAKIETCISISIPTHLIYERKLR